MNQELLQCFRDFTDNERRHQSAGGLRNRSPSSGIVMKAEAFLDAGRLITIQRHFRFASVPEHTHEFVEMVYVCSGQLTHIVNGAEVIQRAGDLLILNQYAKQEILPAWEDDIAVNFIILPQFFEITLGMMGDKDNELRKFLLGCLHNEDQTGGFLHFKVAEVLPVQNLIENLLFTLVNNVPNKRSINQFTMGLLFLHLLNHVDKAYSGSKQGDLIFKILQYVEEHYADGTLSELAGILGYNIRWLSTNIGRLTGSSFKDLQQSKRISQAKFLLATTSLPVADIAKQVGFSNLTYFYRLFQAQANCSPGNFRLYNKLN